MNSLWFLLFALASVLLSHSAKGQSTPPFIIGGPDDQLRHCFKCRFPVYKDGGVEGMSRAIAKNLRVPEHLPDGKVFVQFTVDEHGWVRNAVIKQGLRPDADSAVVRAVRLLGEFIPALDAQGLPTAFRQTIPFTFQLK